MSDSQQSRTDNQKIQQGIISATVWGVGATVPAVLASMWANKNSVFYRTKFSASAKVATPLMVGILFFSMRLEKSAFLLANDNKQWGYNKIGAPSERVSSMPLHHKLMNTIYDNPFTFIAATGLPLAGVILHQQLQLKHLKFQQRIMASRIFAQFGVLSILMVTMGFKNYMDKHGRFEDPEEIEVVRNEDSVKH